MNPAVERHYQRSGLLAAIEAALRRAGKDPAHLAPEDLAPVDEFHVRGRRATLDLAALLRPGAESHVLDIGSGLGGLRACSRRSMAAVSPASTSPKSIAAPPRPSADGSGSPTVSRIAGPTRCACPFAEARFDAAWTQHVAMNIADKAALYREIHRVVRPGGAFALYDVLQGPGGAIHLPVPWAREASASHLVTPATLRALLGEAGFAIAGWRDTTPEARRAFAEPTRRGGGPGRRSASPSSSAPISPRWRRACAATSTRSASC